MHIRRTYWSVSSIESVEVSEAKMATTDSSVAPEMSYCPSFRIDLRILQTLESSKLPLLSQSHEVEQLSVSFESLRAAH